MERMKIPIWIHLFLIITLVTLPVIFFQYNSQKNALIYLSDLLLNDDIESALKNNLSVMKQLKPFLPENEQVELKEVFEKQHHSLTVYKNMANKKQELLDQFTTHVLIITVCALLVALAAAGLLAKNILGRFKRLNHELVDKELRLRETAELENWQQMARRVIHELKGPITPIKLVGGDLTAKFKSGNMTDAYMQEAQSVIMEEVGNIENLISNFTEFAKLPKAEITLNDLTTTVNTFIKRYAYENVTYETINLNRGLRIPHDPEMIQRLLVNIVRNAVEANSHMEELRISLIMEKDVDHCRIIIQDNGKGISREIRDKIFEPYFSKRTADDSVANTNFGLGLSICRKIAFEHYGRIEVAESNDGGRFVLQLPLQKNELETA